MNKATVFDVANYFVSFGKMTHKKLQKLCYYAQAWHLALLNEPLFNSEFEAWIHGPVCPELYHEYKFYGWQDIPQKDFQNKYLSEKTLIILEAVCETYNHFTGDELELLTHSEEPWKSSRGSLEEWEPSCEIIPKKMMKEYYKKVYEQEQND